MMMMRPRKPCSSYAGSAARVSDMPRQPPGSRVPESSPLRNAAISHSDTPRSPCFHPTRTRATRRLAPRQIPLVGLPRNSNDLDRPPGSFLLPSPLLLRRHRATRFRFAPRVPMLASPATEYSIRRYTRHSHHLSTISGFSAQPREGSMGSMQRGTALHVLR